MSVTVADVSERLAVVRARIAAAGGDQSVSVLAVTKTFGLDAVEAALAAGCPAVGENYAQEVAAKFAGLQPLPPVYFIGQLQTNKVRLLVPYVAVYASVDRDSLADEIAKRAPGAHVLVQVDTAAETGKGGCPVSHVPALVERCQAAGLIVDGLMTVGPTDGGPEQARPGFREVRSLVDRLGLSVCSMGMSDDLEVAVAEGATQVRIGSALFGTRPPRD